MTIEATVTKASMGEEDIRLGHGTFTRPSSTGTTLTRTKLGLHSFLPSVYIATAFGTSINDGTTDATSAIQAAIDQCESDGGGEVWFPPGIYLISAALTVDNSRVKLRGFGRDTILEPSVELRPMIYMGASSGSLFPFSSNAIESLHFDFNDTNSVGVVWRRWGQVGVNRDVHFSNPGATAIGIVTSPNSASVTSDFPGGVNEILFDGINWWNSPEAEGGTNEGTAIQINCNNCKVVNSTIMGAATAIEIATTNAISQVVIQGNRITKNDVGIDIGAEGTRSGFGGLIQGNRFEENGTWDIRIHSSSSTFQWHNPVIQANFFSQSAGVFLLYTNGCLFSHNTVKDFTTTTTGGRTTAVKDGTTGSESNGNTAFTAFGNETFFTSGLVGTPITTILPTSLSQVDGNGFSIENRIMGQLMVGPHKGVDAPAQTNAVVYAARDGECYFVARDSTNDVEAVCGASSAGVSVGAKTAHSLLLQTSGSNKQVVTTGGQHFISALGTAPADGDFGDIALREVSFWVNEAGNALTFKVKYIDGTTFKSGTVALT